MRRLCYSVAICAAGCVAAWSSACVAGAPSKDTAKAVIAAIRAKVATTATQDSRVHVHVGNLLAIRQAAPCAHAPHVSLHGHGASRVAEVACPSLAWRYYLPVRVTVRQPEVVARHALIPGARITRADLSLVRNVATGPRVASDVGEVIGKTVSVPVGRGQPVRLGVLREPIAVHTGQEIRVQVTAGNVTLKTTAVALQQGRVGQSILVRGTTTDKQYHVTVGPGGAGVYRMGR